MIMQPVMILFEIYLTIQLSEYGLPFAVRGVVWHASIQPVQCLWRSPVEATAIGAATMIDHL